MELTLTTKIDIPTSVLEDVLDTALAGGIQYWGYIIDTATNEDGSIRWAIIQEHDPDEASKTFHLQASDILHGVRLLHGALGTGERDVHPDSEIGSQLLHHLFADQDDDGLNMGDAVLADAIVQMACFEEIKYG